MEQSNRLTLIERAKFVNDKPEEIRVRLKSLVESGEIMVKQIAKHTSFSSSSISQMLNDKYEGDIEKLEDSLGRFYRYWLATNAVVKTHVVEAIQMTMMLAWKRKEIASIVGEYGRGKSKAASHFVALNDFAVYLELPSTTSASSLLYQLSVALNIGGAQMVGSQHDKLMTIIRSLQREPRLLVIDEADNLRPRTLAILKDIHGGESLERCAIILIGTERLNKVLRHPELGYLQRRVRIKKRIDEVTLDEAVKIIDMYPHSLDRDDLKQAYSWSLKHFGVASLVTLMARSIDEMQLRKKKEIDTDCLEAGYTWISD